MSEPKKTISIVDISRMAGVSIATVSRIINHNGRYSKETEKRVNEIIEKYQYSPNMTAKRLRTRHANFIGLIVPDITNEFFARIVQLIQLKLREKNYLALVCNTNENPDVQKDFLTMLGIANLAGLIFISDSMPEQIPGLSALPTVYIDRVPESVDQSNALLIESDNYGGACLAVRELYQAGCRKIAFMRSEKIISTHSIRQPGYFDQISRLGLTPDEKMILRVKEVSFLDAKENVLRLLDQQADFDGIFCATDWLALGALAALEERGIHVPEQVKVVGFDDISVAALTARPLTTIHQQIDVMAQTAVNEMMRLIGGEAATAQRIQIGVSLVRRQTT